MEETHKMIIERLLKQYDPTSRMHLRLKLMLDFIDRGTILSASEMKLLAKLNKTKEILPCKHVDIMGGCKKGKKTRCDSQERWKKGDRDCDFYEALKPPKEDGISILNFVKG